MNDRRSSTIRKHQTSVRFRPGIHELGEVENEYTSHNFSLRYLSAENDQYWWKFDDVLTKTILQSFLRHGVYKLYLISRWFLAQMSCS